jgi:hypothetical protein
MSRSFSSILEAIKDAVTAVGIAVKRSIERVLWEFKSRTCEYRAGPFFCDIGGDDRPPQICDFEDCPL